MRGSTARRILPVFVVAVAVVFSAVALTPAARSQPITFMVVWFLGFNTTQAPFNNVAARQAVASALDRNQIATAAEAPVAVGIEPQGCLGYNAGARMHPFNTDRAKELLAQSGVNLEEYGDVSVWHLSRLKGREARRKELDILTANISAIGLRPTLREFGNYDALERIATLPVVKMSYWGVITASPLCANESGFLEDLVSSKGELNFFGYKNADVDSLLDQARRAGDRQTKARLYQEAQQKVLDDAVLVPIYQYTVK